MEQFKKVCKVCGKEFLTTNKYKKICPEIHYAKCPVCSKLIEWNTTREVEPCSRECSKERTKQRNLAKYGVEHPMQCKQVQNNHKKAMLDKYGVESPLQSAEIKQKAIDSNREKFGTDWALGNKELKKRAQQTMIEKYGAATTLQSQILRSKVEATCIERYGFANPALSVEVRSKISNSNFLKYGFVNPMQNSEIAQKSIASRIEHYGEFWPDEIANAVKKTFMERYGYDNVSKNPEIKAKIKLALIEKYGEDYGLYLTRNVEHNAISNINRAFMRKLEDRGLKGEFEFGGIGRYRYDIVLADQKTLIEINPTYTHNAIGNHWSDTGIDPDYHRVKTKWAHDAGYRCINVFDWDDWDRVIDIIAPKQVEYARKCSIYKLQPKAASEFLAKYHLQGTVNKQVLCLGLVKDGEILQVMTFGAPRYNKKYSAELLRLCTKSGVTVVGGASKLFKFATSYLEVDDIISYCDLSKFNGDVYSKIGMKFKEFTNPQEVWSKGDEKITANLLRARGYDQLFGTNYGKGTSNNELMISNGWLPVYDCGQAVYTYSSSDN